MKKRYIIVPILIGTMAISSYTILKVKHLENENNNLKNELRNKQKTKTEYKVTVEDIEGQPGYYSAKFYLRPHYQLEGLTTSLRLTTKVPSGAK